MKKIKTPPKNDDAPKPKRGRKPKSAEVPTTPKTIKRKTRRKKKTPSKNIYFSQETEDSIVVYNATEDMPERNKIFNEKIQYPFEKLAENILNTFKFSYFECSHKDVQQETLSFLVSNIHKYKQENGKAFSYFSIVAKNFLILYNNGNYKKFKKHTSVDDTEVVYDHKELTVFPAERRKRVEMGEFMKLMVEYWDRKIELIFKKPQELKIAYAIIEIFRKCDSMENFNKKALYLYIREMTGCKTQNITKVVNKMRNIQKNIQDEYRSQGYIDMD